MTDWTRKGVYPLPLLFCPAPPACVHVNRCVYIIRLFLYTFLSHLAPQTVVTHVKRYLFYIETLLRDLWSKNRAQFTKSQASNKFHYVSSYFERYGHICCSMRKALTPLHHKNGCCIITAAKNVNERVRTRSSSQSKARWRKDQICGQAFHNSLSISKSQVLICNCN